MHFLDNENICYIGGEGQEGVFNKWKQIGLRFSLRTTVRFYEHANKKFKSNSVMYSIHLHGTQTWAWGDELWGTFCLSDGIQRGFILRILSVASHNVICPHIIRHRSGGDVLTCLRIGVLLEGRRDGLGAGDSILLSNIILEFTDIDLIIQNMYLIHTGLCLCQTNLLANFIIPVLYLI